MKSISNEKPSQNAKQAAGNSNQITSLMKSVVLLHKNEFAKKLAAVALACCTVLTVFPTTVFAADAEPPIDSSESSTVEKPTTDEEDKVVDENEQSPKNELLASRTASQADVYVNGINISTVADNQVACGSGTAVYDPETATLTLNNAVIDTAYNNCGICVNYNGPSQEVLTINLVGTNSITTKSSNQISKGIFTFGKVAISGSGTLEITTSSNTSSYIPCGIYAWNGCSITNTTINLYDTTDPSLNLKSVGIDVNQFESALLIDQTKMNIDGLVFGINVPSNSIAIKNHSDLTITNANRGISGGNESDSFSITDSKLDITTTGENALGLLSGKEILINNSTIAASSDTSNAIYTDGKIRVINGSNLDTSGFYPALFAGNDIEISGSIVKADSSDDCGIFTKANLSVTGNSDVTANGYYAAIRANGTMAVSGGKVTAASSDDCGIYAIGDLTISNQADVKANGLFAALRSDGNLRISGGKVDVTSSNDLGIFSKGVIEVTGGTVKAKGSTAAIAARQVKLTEADPAAKITLSSVTEKDGGEIAVADWFEVTLQDSTKEDRSWTSFVGKDETEKLSSDLSNALKEVTLNPVSNPTPPPVSNGGWVSKNNSQWQYQKADGSYAKNEWKQINGKWYYFGTDSYMKTGWQQLGGQWYYLQNSGDMKTGWAMVNGNWYYLNDSGSMVTGWKQVQDGTWYLLNQNGVMATSWQIVNGNWYYMNEKGAMCTGWTVVGGSWYYLKDSGVMATGWLKDQDGAWYYLTGNGSMAMSWQMVGDSWYYLNGKGVMQTGWVSVNSKWYYLNQNGAMAANTTTPDGYKVNQKGEWIGR